MAKLQGRRQSKNVEDMRRFSRDRKTKVESDMWGNDVTPSPHVASAPTPPIPQRVSDDFDRATMRDRMKNDARQRTRMGSVVSGNTLVKNAKNPANQKRVRGR